MKSSERPQLTRRQWLGLTPLLGWGGMSLPAIGALAQHEPALARDLTIAELIVTPVALPDPPILAASGCHGPYFLRTIVQVRTRDGVVGIGETHGGQAMADALLAARARIIGRSALAYRQFAGPALALRPAAYAGLELACLDAIGRAMRLRLAALLGGPLRERIEFAAYLFYRFAADHPRVLDDPRLVDGRARGASALDDGGEVRTPEAMAAMAARFRQRFGFRVFKLKAGVLDPDAELQTLQLIDAQFKGQAPLRVDPNGRWTQETALRAANRLADLPLEYYEDPVRTQAAMAAIRRATGLKMATNSCVTRMEHIPEAVKTEPVDVVLADHHGWGGFAACQSLGAIADALGWTLGQHSNNHAGITMAAMVHLAAVVPQLIHASDTHYPWLAEGADVIQGANLRFRDGFMDVPVAPGVGVELDPDKLARAHETYRKCGMQARDDAATMRRFEPGWQPTPL